MSARILLIDNYDSFTFNLVQGFRVLGAEVRVYRNDEISLDQASSMDPTHLVISPGPGNPDDAGISVDAIRAFEDIGVSRVIVPLFLLGPDPVAGMKSLAENIVAGQD